MSPPYTPSQISTILAALPADFQQKRLGPHLKTPTDILTYNPHLNAPLTLLTPPQTHALLTTASQHFDINGPCSPPPTGRTLRTILSRLDGVPEYLHGVKEWDHQVYRHVLDTLERVVGASWQEAEKARVMAEVWACVAPEHTRAVLGDYRVRETTTTGKWWDKHRISSGRAADVEEEEEEEENEERLVQTLRSLGVEVVVGAGNSTAANKEEVYRAAREAVQEMRFQALVEETFKVLIAIEATRVLEEIDRVKEEMEREGKRELR